MGRSPQTVGTFWLWHARISIMAPATASAPTSAPAPAPALSYRARACSSSRHFAGSCSATFSTTSSADYGTRDTCGTSSTTTTESNDAASFSRPRTPCSQPQPPRLAPYVSGSGRARRRAIRGRTACANALTQLWQMEQPAASKKAAEEYATFSSPTWRSLKRLPKQWLKTNLTCVAPAASGMLSIFTIGLHTRRMVSDLPDITAMYVDFAHLTEVRSQTSLALQLLCLRSAPLLAT
jgi:hypothetical protein